MRKVLVLLVLGMMVLQAISFNVKGDDYQSISSQVKMKERWLKVTVFYYKGNEKWARDALDLSIRVLPIIEDITGFPYPQQYDVNIYETIMEKSGGWGGSFGGENGILITPTEYWDGDLIHEQSHAWTQIYKGQWMEEGFANFYTNLVLEKLGRKGEAMNMRNRNIQDFVDKVKTFDWPLGKDFYTSPKPKDWSEEDEKRKDFCYKKSFIFIYLMYREFGLEALQKINLTSYQRKSQYNTLDFKKALEKVTNKKLDDFFSGWISEDIYKVYSPKDFQDSDSDGLMNFEEKILGINSNVADTDGDGIGDGLEIKLGTDPRNPDTDGDGLKDGEEAGIVIDGVAKEWDSIQPIITDPQGDIEGDDKRSADIKMIKLVMDDNYLYLLMEIYGEFCSDCVRNYFIDVSYDGKFWDYDFGFRPSGYVWVLVHDKKTNEWTEQSAPAGMIASGKKNVVEVRIPRKPFDIPISFGFGCRITNNVISLDETSYDLNFSIEKFQAPQCIDPLNPDTDGDGLKDGVDPHPLEKEDAWKKRISEEASNLFSQAQTEFQNQNYQKAKELFSQIKTKYEELKDDAKVKEADEWIKKCEEEISVQSQSLIPQPQEQKKTSIPVLFMIFAILFVYMRKKVKK